jgi:hypothetical protein
MMLENKQFLTLILSEIDNWAMATCPEFKIGTFGETKDNAKEQLYDNVKVASYVIAKRKKQGESVDRRILSYAEIINNNGAAIKEYFREVLQK